MNFLFIIIKGNKYSYIPPDSYPINIPIFVIFPSFELTLIVVKQTIGRAFRDPNDYVKVYLCDSRYKEYFSDLGVSEKEIKLFV
uniref:ATP-dependent helicase C-terminal domain-containing protein n=1 Tax=Saccharolobus islandicus TaxID=43080 RepID=Q5W2N1_SACIS|nr:helicase C-terminal domain-containing protein [Sulfolobus islandicus]CAG38265.1 hypothetical protein [Sulfolobus islandicus]